MSDTVTDFEKRNRRLETSGLTEKTFEIVMKDVIWQKNTKPLPW